MSFPIWMFSMKKAEWPGIATAVGCCLILAIIIVGSPGAFHLQEWQQSIAAIVALFAATVAYRGVMRKIEFDRDAAAEEKLRRRFGLATRLQYAIHVIQLETNFNLTTLKGAEPSFDLQRLKHITTEGLEEVWSQLEHLPKGLVYNVGQIRLAVFNIELFLRVNNKDDWEYGPDGALPGPLQAIVKVHEHLLHVSKTIGVQLNQYGGGFNEPTGGWSKQSANEVI